MRTLMKLEFILIALGLFCIAMAAFAWPAAAAQPQPLPTNPAPAGASSPTALNQALIFLPSVLVNAPAEATPTGFIQHAGQLLDYTGAETCQGCHPGEVHDFAASNHYQWAGKLGVLNDFCGYPDINFGPGKLTTTHGTQVDGGCATCHAGMGARPATGNPQNADCLTCHATEYRRTLTDVGGAWRFIPDRAAMPATITIQSEPTRYACLTCHTYAGGGCNNKRGDMSDALENPTPEQDVHMGNGLTCVDCHLEDAHQIAGRGVDLRIDEGVAMRACTECHQPQQDHSGNLLEHLDKVACQSCHIPTFARSVSTDMLRDFRASEVNERGLYEPVITRAANVVPTYAFWNGQSGFYNFRAPAAPGQALAWPLGDINDGKLFPFKLHQAIQPIDLITQAILPLKSGILFQTGNIDRSIRVGAQETGFNLEQGYGFIETQRYMGIFHEMPPAGQALGCSDCHATSTRIDFTALGYAPKSTRNGQPLCTSCHGQKESLDFYKLHTKHVDDKDISCSQCHNFTR